MFFAHSFWYDCRYKQPKGSEMSDKPRVVILGGGFGGLFTALGLGRDIDTTLVTDEDHFLFRPMLYEYLSGEVEEWHIAPKYPELIDEHIRWIQNPVATIDLNSRTVRVVNRSDPVKYDVLVLALGGVTNFAGVEGA